MAENIGMVPLLSLSMIQESIMGAKLDYNSERKREARKRLDYYSGDQRRHTDDVMRAQFQNPERMRLQLEFSNITREIVDQVSMLYKKPAKRTLLVGGKPVSDEIAARYAEMTRVSQLDSVMKRVNRFTTLLNTVGVQVAWRKDCLCLDILTPDLVDVAQDPWDPTTAVAVLIYRSFYNTMSWDKAVNPYTDKILVVAWTAEQHMVFDNMGRRQPQLANDQGVNPYGMIPVAWFRDAHPMGCFFNDGSYDLVQAQESLNIKLTELNYLLKMQAFSVPVIIQDDTPGTVTIDPSVFVHIPLKSIPGAGQPDFKFVSPDPKVNELLEAIRDMTVRTARSWGISPDAFKLVGSATSGFALRMQNMRLLERREDDADIYAVAEQNLFRVMRAVWNAHSPEGAKIPEEAELSVDFTEPVFPEDPDAEQRRWESLVRQGLKSKADWLMEIDPDVKTLEEAEEKLRKNMEINARVAGSAPAPSEALNGLVDGEEEPA